MNKSDSDDEQDKQSDNESDKSSTPKRNNLLNDDSEDDLYKSDTDNIAVDYNEKQANDNNKHDDDNDYDDEEEGDYYDNQAALKPKLPSFKQALQDQLESTTTSNIAKGPKFLYQVTQQKVTEFDMMNSFKKPQQEQQMAKKKEYIVEQVIEKKSEETITANLSAIEKRIEEQNKVVNPFSKSRVQLSRFEERKQKREKQNAKNERGEKRRMQKQIEKDDLKLKKLKNEL
eukprot:403364580